MRVELELTRTYFKSQRLKTKRKKQTMLLISSNSLTGGTERIAIGGGSYMRKMLRKKALNHLKPKD